MGSWLLSSTSGQIGSKGAPCKYRMTSIGAPDAALIVHSQTTRHSQPSSLSRVICLWSRAWFRFRFSIQNAVFDLGSRVPTGQLWPCQKHPLTKTTFFRLGNTRSGRPGSLASCSRYLNPKAWSFFRSSSSGLVFLDLILAM